MTLSELLDTLEDISTQISECVGNPHLDTGQTQMLAEADARIAQTRKELRQFDDSEPLICEIDVLTAEEEGWTH